VICTDVKAPDSVLGRGAVAVAALGTGAPSGDARRGFLHHLSTLEHQRDKDTVQRRYQAAQKSAHTTITTTRFCCTKVVHRAIQRLYTHHRQLCDSADACTKKSITKTCQVCKEEQHSREQR